MSMANNRKRWFSGSAPSNAAAMVNKRRGKRIHLPILLGVALHYLDATNATEEYLAGPFAATSHSEGNIFEIVAKSKQISVTRFDINIDAGTDTIEIKSRPGVSGRVVDLNDSGWALVNAFAGVVGQGKNNVTPLPAFDVPINIPAGSKQAFYVTTTPGYIPVNIWYHSGTSYENAYASNDDLELLEGYGVGSANGYTGWGGPRRWNGNVYYTVSDNGSTTSPVSIPSESPSVTSKPSLTPSHVPTVDPNKSPTQSPVQKQTDNLTPSPITYSPTQSPLFNDPKKSPSSSPSAYPTLLPTAKFASQPTSEYAPSGMPSPTPSQAVDSSFRTQSPSTSLSPSSSLSPSISLHPASEKKLTQKPTRAPFSSAQRIYRHSALLTCLNVAIIYTGLVFVV